MFSRMKARGIVAEFGLCDEAPVSLSSLCERLKVRVKAASDETERMVLSVFLPESRIIFVAPGGAEEQRVSIARDLWGVVGGHSPTVRTEAMKRDADAFASEILLPTFAVKRLWRGQRVLDMAGMFLNSRGSLTSL